MENTVFINDTFSVLRPWNWKHCSHNCEYQMIWAVLNNETFLPMRLWNGKYCSYYWDFSIMRLSNWKHCSH